MRIVEMDPHEALPSSIRVPPSGRRLEDRRGAALLFDEVDGGLTLPIVVVVLVETLIEAEARVERKRADKCARGVARSTQDRGHGRVLGSENKPGVIVDAMLIRIQP